MHKTVSPKPAPVVTGEPGPLADAVGRALEDVAATHVWVHVSAGAPAPVFTLGSAGEDADRVSDILACAFHTVQDAVTAMRAVGGGGSIVLIAPPGTGGVAHDAVRQGLRLLAKSAALELGPEAIRVNIVLPGHGPTPLGGVTGPGAIAAAVAFAASDRARFMTGADVVVDGGRMAL